MLLKVKALLQHYKCKGQQLLGPFQSLSSIYTLKREKEKKVERDSVSILVEVNTTVSYRP